MKNKSVLIPSSFYKSIFEDMLDGLAYCQIIFDAEERPIDFVFLLVNKKFDELTGLKGVIGKKVTELIPGIRKNNPEILEIYSRVASTGSAEKFETYVKGLDIWVWISIYCPKKGYFIAIFQNIYDRKKIEIELANETLAIRNLLEDLNIQKVAAETAKVKEETALLSIGDGLLATDEKGNITLINKTAENLLGLKSEEVVGKSFVDTIIVEDEKKAIVPLDKRPIKLALAGITTNTNNSGLFYYYLRKDKTRFPVAMTVTPVILNNKVIGTIEIFRDITKEKEIDRAKTEFVSLASHQLRTPLTAISWYTEMILNGDVGKVIDDQRKYLEEIYHGNRRMVELVNTLLNVSRIELGTFVIKPEPIDIIALAQTALEEQKFKIEQRNLKITTSFDKNIPTLMADPKTFPLIFQNLLSNAVSYSLSGGKIGFSISSDKERNILIKISDTGLGIPRNQQRQIFTKLFRADNIIDKNTDGTGLGLYIVKSIVEGSGGRIWFESEEDKGSTFFISLPADGPKR